MLLLDRADRTLLFFTRADVATHPTRWLTPGGHVEPGESHHEAAVRELFEETGLVVSDLGEPFWSRDFVAEPAPGVLRDYHEEWYLHRTAPFEPVDTNWTDDERVDVEQWRWFTLADLDETADPVEPADLRVVLRSALER
ncbi:NUDIX domain-containing protein [Herbiconiux sp. CPCC 203386]|uniref:NUDIX domain-containing protein n=1 Tax=Herbiconiux daphne TaxID=2970914 RepID=A0ABT2GZL8_9MICO|nr:NUDIX domain-containing protein [Herbiconiux daphne]